MPIDDGLLELLLGTHYEQNTHAKDDMPPKNQNEKNTHAKDDKPPKNQNEQHAHAEDDKPPANEQHTHKSPEEFPDISPPPKKCKSNPSAASASTATAAEVEAAAAAAGTPHSPLKPPPRLKYDGIERCYISDDHSDAFYAAAKKADDGLELTEEDLFDLIE